VRAQTVAVGTVVVGNVAVGSVRAQTVAVGTVPVTGDQGCPRRTIVGGRRCPRGSGASSCAGEVAERPSRGRGSRVGKQWLILSAGPNRTGRRGRRDRPRGQRRQCASCGGSTRGTGQAGGPRGRGKRSARTAGPWRTDRWAGNGRGTETTSCGGCGCRRCGGTESHDGSGSLGLGRSRFERRLPPSLGLHRCPGGGRSRVGKRDQDVVNVGPTSARGGPQHRVLPHRVRPSSICPQKRRPRWLSRRASLASRNSRPVGPIVHFR
jgi:hypothetical protein